ncbi:MAG: pseudouridine synthase [Flavobacteriales bacterium]
MQLEILFQDEDLVIINKPHGLLVHRSAIARDVQEFALQILRDQIGQAVYPVHRLDRKTSGILVFALNKPMLKAMNVLFQENKPDKTYLAIVRGFTPNAFSIDKALPKENGTLQESLTHFHTLEHVEKPWKTGNFETSRYSLIEAKPVTGRMHQIRRHLNHFRHPIIGDRPHGCNKQNKFFKNEFDLSTMYLHAFTLEFIHPTTEELMSIKAPFSPEFDYAAKKIFEFNWFETHE